MTFFNVYRRRKLKSLFFEIKYLQTQNSELETLQMQKISQHFELKKKAQQRLTLNGKSLTTAVEQKTQRSIYQHGTMLKS